MYDPQRTSRRSAGLLVLASGLFLASAGSVLVNAQAPTAERDAR